MVRHGLVWMAPPCGSWSFMFLASVMQPVYFTARPQYTLAAAQESRLHEATPLQDSRPIDGAFAGSGHMSQLDFAGRRDLLSVQLANQLAVRLAYLLLA